MSFKGYKRTVELAFNYDEVKQGVPNVKKQMAVLNAEFKKSSAEAVASGKEVDKLGTRYDFLSNKLKILQTEVEGHKKKLEEARNAQGNNTKAVDNHTTSLRIAEAKLAETKAELAQVTKELDKQKTTLGLTADQWENVSDKLGSIGRSMSLKLTAPIVAAAAASFKLGADLEDAMGKANVVFGKNTRIVEEWSKQSLKNFGLARVTAMTMVTDFAAGFSQLGIHISRSTEWSMNLTSLVNDMATFYNATTEETERALTAILSGQTEPLKKFQIFMTQANLQQFAYQQGIRKTINEMTEAEKVQLRYNYVMDKTTQAHGNFKREQDSATAQLTLFKESVKELTTSFSEEVLPVLTPVLTKLNNVIQKFADMDEGTRKVIVTLAGIVAVVGPVLVILNSMLKFIMNLNSGIKATTSIIDTVSKAGKAFSTLLTNTQFLGFVKWAGIIAGVALAVAALVTAFNFLIGRGDKIIEFTRSMSDMFSGVGSSIRNIPSIGQNVTNPYINTNQRMGIDYTPNSYSSGSSGYQPTSQPVSTNQGTNYYSVNVKMDEVDEVSKLVKVFDDFKMAKRAGLASD